MNAYSIGGEWIAIRTPSNGPCEDGRPAKPRTKDGVGIPFEKRRILPSFREAQTCANRGFPAPSMAGVMVVKVRSETEEKAAVAGHHEVQRALAIEGYIRHFDPPVSPARLLEEET